MRSFATALVGLSLVAGCQIHAGPPRDISGEDLYLRQCARCHGPDGRGIAGEASAADISTRLRTISDRELEVVIKQGKPPRMPGFGEQFLEPSLRTLMAYVRELGSKTPTEAIQPATVEPTPTKSTPAQPESGASTPEPTATDTPPPADTQKP